LDSAEETVHEMDEEGGSISIETRPSSSRIDYRASSVLRDAIPWAVSQDLPKDIQWRQVTKSFTAFFYVICALGLAKTAEASIHFHMKAYRWNFHTDQ